MIPYFTRKEMKKVEHDCTPRYKKRLLDSFSCQDRDRENKKLDPTKRKTDHFHSLRVYVIIRTTWEKV
jgi:hypothetical protein